MALKGEREKERERERESLKNSKTETWEKEREISNQSSAWIRERGKERDKEYLVVILKLVY